MSRFYRGKGFDQSNSSNAEDKVLKLLCKARLNETLQHGFRTQEYLVLRQTIPDFYFPEKRLCIYLDGPPHLKGKNEMNDAEIDALLDERNYKVLRRPYKYPLSNGEAEKILAEIVEAVNTK